MKDNQHKSDSKNQRRKPKRSFSKSKTKAKKENKANFGKTEQKPEEQKNTRRKKPFSNEKKSFNSSNTSDKSNKKERFEQRDDKKSRTPRHNNNTPSTNRDNKADTQKSPSTTQNWRLNRFIANSGVCSRREADTLIAKGEISVNGKVVKEMGYKVKPQDEVKYKNRVLRREKPVYLLLNKPKDFITTVKDPKGRRTVMDLVKNATDERIYPVGRLDRQTTGLLLFTNDGEMAKKLSHPSYEVQKIYKAELDKPISPEDIEKLKSGLELEDGIAKADGAAILSPDAKLVGLELHMGKNRIVRRMFAHLGYEVVRLDRTVFAGLTKESIGRGQWRFLNEREIIRLRFFNKRGK